MYRMDYDNFKLFLRFIKRTITCANNISTVNLVGTVYEVASPCLDSHISNLNEAKEFAAYIANGLLIDAA